MRMSRQLHGLLQIDMGHQGRHGDLYGLTNREESEDRFRTMRTGRMD